MSDSTFRAVILIILDKGYLEIDLEYYTAERKIPVSPVIFEILRDVEGIPVEYFYLRDSIRVESQLYTADSLGGFAIVRDDVNLAFGIASPTGTILDKEYFVINHNDSWKIPYWVGYYLTDSSLAGTVQRSNDFRPDPELPEGLRAELIDYRGSGYDRGHNAPAAAFKRSREAMSTTFLLSNMSPQTPRLNRRIWRVLEEQVRDLVYNEGKAWVLTGNIFLSPASQPSPPSEYIGTDLVAVPSHCFKAILSLNEDGGYAAYAFLIPNQKSAIPGATTDYLILIDDLEDITGYDFFPDLDDEIENQIEAMLPMNWPPGE